MLRKKAKRDLMGHRKSKGVLWKVFTPVLCIGSILACAGMLAASFETSEALAAEAQMEPQESRGPSLNINLDGSLFDAMFKPLQDMQEEGTEAAKEPDGPESLFLEEDGKLYVMVDGRKLQVVDTDDGLRVIEEDGSDEPIGEVADVGNPKIMVDENGNRYYHIVWGDTLCKISSDVHYSVDELAEYNHIRNVHLIYAESDLRIPD